VKLQVIFKMTGLCQISIKVETYRNQNGLTQCYNFQKFSHIWAHCNRLCFVVNIEKQTHKPVPMITPTPFSQLPFQIHFNKCYYCNSSWPGTKPNKVGLKWQ
jgi:hypothetical protein